MADAALRAQGNLCPMGPSSRWRLKNLVFEARRASSKKRGAMCRCLRRRNYAAGDVLVIRN